MATTEKYGMFQVPNALSGLKVFKGTSLGPAEYLSKHRLRMMNQQEMARYFSKVTRSNGFDVDGCTGSLAGGIVPLHRGTPDYNLAKILTPWAAFTGSGKRLSNLALVKANLQPVCGMMFYITFSATDTVDQLKKYFRAQVLVLLKGTKDLDLDFELKYYREFKPPKIQGKGFNSTKKAVARRNKAPGGSMLRSKISKAEKGAVTCGNKAPGGSMLRSKIPKAEKGAVTRRNKAQGGSMLRSKITKAKKGAACVLPGFTALLLDIKSGNPSMTHAMARAAASRKWKMLSNAEKQAFLSEAGLKTQG